MVLLIEILFLFLILVFRLFIIPYMGLSVKVVAFLLCIEVLDF